MHTHHGERDIGAVGRSEEAPFRHPEDFAQIDEVLDVLERVVGAEIDPLGDQSVVTGPGRRDVLDADRRRIVDEAHRLGVEGVDLGAEKSRRGIQGSALGQHDQILVLVQCRNQEFDVAHRIAAGTAGYVEQRLMLRGLADRRNDRDRDADRLSVLLVTVLRHDQLPALRLGEGRRRSHPRRAGAGLEARHGAGSATRRRYAADGDKGREDDRQRCAARRVLH